MGAKHKVIVTFNEDTRNFIASCADVNVSQEGYDAAEALNKMRMTVGDFMFDNLMDVVNQWEEEEETPPKK